MLLQRFNRGIILKNCIKLVSTTSQSSYSTRKSSETHYDVLKLTKTCSSRQIRDAFIKLSKESHPDRNSDPKTHEKFVRINEAYNTLIKPDSRAEYDYKIFIQVKQTPRSHVQDDPIYEKPFRDPSFYENRDRSKDDENKNQPYYGIKGINRVSNKTLVWFIVVFTFFGVGLQALAIMVSLTFSRSDMMQRSKEFGDNYKSVKMRAAEYGNLERQIEEMERRRSGV